MQGTPETVMSLGKCALKINNESVSSNFRESSVITGFPAKERSNIHPGLGPFESSSGTFD